VESRRNTIMRAAADGELELARQERKLRVECRPLPKDFRMNARIN
jgi:hypothetical protein